MELYAYQYAISKDYIEENESKSMPIKDVFDMLAGASTGGVIAAALTVPADEYKNKSFEASAVLKNFKEQIPMIFKI